MQAFRFVYMLAGFALVVLALIGIAKESSTPNLILQFVVGAILVIYGWNRYKKHDQRR